MTTIHARQTGLSDLEVHRAAGSHLSVVCRQSCYHGLGLGVARSRLSLEPNGVDVEAFRPGPRPAQGLHAALGLASHVHVVGGVDDVRPIYHDLDLLVSSSHSEAMPLALMEGMASGLPVVATRVGGVPEIVEHGDTGWLVVPRDVEDLAGRMHQMLTQSEMRQRMGEQTRARMVRHHRLDRHLDALGDRMRRIARPGSALEVAWATRGTAPARKR